MRWNQEAEESVLGAALLNNNIIPELIADLTAEDFYRPGHQYIFSAITELYLNGRGVDTLTVADVLRKQNVLEDLGGQVKILELMTNTPGASMYGTYAAIVRRESSARKLDIAFGEARRSLSEGTDPVEVADAAEVALRGLDRGGRLPERYWSSWNEYAAADHVGAGVPLVDGFSNQHTRIILLATEKLGKSMLARQIAFCIAAGLHPWTFKPIEPVRVLVLDCENDDDELLPTSKRLETLLKNNPHAGEGRPALMSSPYGMDLRSRRDRSELEEVLDEVRPQIIVGGPLYKMLPQDASTSDPRHAEELQRILDNVRKRWGCALLLEHHAPAGQPGQRREIRSVGGQRWAAWPEVTIALHAESDDDGTESAVVKFPHPTRGRFRWPRQFYRATREWEWPWTPVLRNEDVSAILKEQVF